MGGSDRDAAVLTMELFGPPREAGLLVGGQQDPYASIRCDDGGDVAALCYHSPGRPDGLRYQRPLTTAQLIAHAEIDRDLRHQLGDHALPDGLVDRHTGDLYRR